MEIYGFSGMFEDIDIYEIFMKIVEDDGNLGHSLNLGDLDMYRIDFWVNGRRTRFFGTHVAWWNGMPSKKT